MVRLALLLLFLVSSVASAENEDYTNLEQRINELTDKLEQLTHKNDILQKKFDALAEDVEFRFKQQQTTKTTPIENKQPAQETAVKKDPKNAKEDFDAALKLLKEQNYAAAEQALSSFVKSYPNSEYTGNAYYWLGESFLLRKKYEKAAINYIMSFNKYPKNNKADLSMIKLVTSLNILGKKKEACTTIAKIRAKKTVLSPALQKMFEKEIKKADCK